jgi:antitoxin MazE
MTTRTHMARWGNSLAMRIPKHVAEQASLDDGDELLVEVDAKGTLIVRTAKGRPSLAELAQNITTDNVHRAEDWGGRSGKETW